MTPLGELLLKRLAEAGPMPLSDYMAECLMHPHYGYYATRDPFGQAGDFITAPEISQVFGELLGLWLAQSWMDLGAPAPFVLAEAGPGRGTLMADILRATRRVPGFHDSMRIVLVEASPKLREVQGQSLSGFAVDWADTLADLPDLPLFMVANEFLDALPIRQFRRSGDGWREVMVTEKGGRLAFALSSPLRLGALEERLDDTEDGEIVETCLPAQAVAAEAGARIADHGGVALFIDYGGWHSLGDTFQALKAHQPVDPLAEPGEADLTAHVDFEALAHALPDGCHAGYMTQGALLQVLGIGARGEQLSRSLSGQMLHSHQTGIRRLTEAEGMGSLFKALAIWRSGGPTPPAFVPLSKRASHKRDME